MASIPDLIEVSDYAVRRGCKCRWTISTSIDPQTIYIQHGENPEQRHQWSRLQVTLAVDSFSLVKPWVDEVIDYAHK